MSQSLVPSMNSISDRLLDGTETCLVQVLSSEDEQRAMQALEVRIATHRSESKRSA